MNRLNLNSNTHHQRSAACTESSDAGLLWMCWRFWRPYWNGTKMCRNNLGPRPNGSSDRIRHLISAPNSAICWRLNDARLFESLPGSCRASGGTDYEVTKSLAHSRFLNIFQKFHQESFCEADVYPNPTGYTCEEYGDDFY